ncbi:hypothetical protein F5144DRAFT_290761 [Chaetomium tenue]|uniref:Uncharacterized protein n=1 Tax=Chaetomium tenue TaxID=1854479 RepID=A0ACB7P489_9PEZI|nr:hypothetical protein F5144DRAFT_290761 [Chaetomium globosum]
MRYLVTVLSSVFDCITVVKSEVAGCGVAFPGPEGPGSQLTPYSKPPCTKNHLVLCMHCKNRGAQRKARPCVHGYSAQTIR